jgi:hypothetical protein
VAYDRTTGDSPEVINDVAFIGQIAENFLPDVPCSRSP